MSDFYQEPGVTPEEPQQPETEPLQQEQPQAAEPEFTSEWTAPEPEEPTPQPEVKVKKKKSKTWIWVIVALLVGALIGAAVIYALNPSAAPAAAETTKGDSYELVEQPVKKTLKTNTGDKSLTPAEVYAQNVGAVVGISTEKTATNIFGQRTSRATGGSGFILTEDGYVVTNNHITEGANSIKVTLYNGDVYDAKLVGSYAVNDVSLLKIDATDLQCVSVGKSSDLVAGEQVAAIGNPLFELTNSITVGYVSAVNREITIEGKQLNMIQTDVVINAGNSGGPLFDMNGNVVGITTAKYSGQTNTGSLIEGTSFAIPLDDVIDVLMDIQQNGRVTGRPYLGVRLLELDEYTANVYGLPVGPYVQEVDEGSCVEKAGMQQGDIIIKFDGTEVTTYNQLVAALNKHKAGDTVKITVFRAGAEVDLQVTLDERPAEDTAEQQPQQEQQTQQEQQQQQQ
ncbi:MAG: trypsin-like peptidase domain-containing protein, partial [Oscillospiraceae bacterium]|nr:trypsin-like peptidase domain-containing protein [Oscillospiraceae bacterium]